MTYRLPSLNTLRAFEAAGRHLSFKTAASELGVTAGAVSQQVKKLETSLGVMLFRRLPHGLLLTTEGEIYLPLITRVFEDLTHATELIAPKINSRKFTVGICSSIKAVLPDNWPKHSDDLTHHVRDKVETSDIEMLRSNELDCLVKAGGTHHQDFALVVIPNSRCEQDLYFICRPGLIDCAQSKAILKDLKLHLIDASV